jgi:type I restriction enzyme R subunit
MKHTDTTEKAFQNDIIAHLVSTGYHKRTNENYNKPSCIDPELTLQFIQDTQEREWKKFQRVYGEQSEQKFFYRLVSEIDKKGTINVLRNGFKDVGCHFELFYPKPNNRKNPGLFEQFEKNIFSLIDELEYEHKEDGKRLDLVISVNGVTRFGISTYPIKNSFVIVPPLHEQTAIANFLDKATAKIDKTIQKIEEKVKLLEEYKKSLIHHVVTGKVDVRKSEV